MTIVSLLGDPSQQIDLQLWPCSSLSAVPTLQSWHLLKVFFTFLPKPDIALGNTELLFSSTISILLCELDNS